MGTCTNKGESLEDAELPGIEAGEISSSLGRSTSALPAARITAEGEAIEWVNRLLAHLWPDMEKVAREIIDEKITPLMQAKAAAAPSAFGLKDIHFSHFSLGKVTPRIERLACVPAEAFGGVRCHLYVEYDSDMHMELDAGHVTLGVKSFKISGEAVVLIRPVMDEIQGVVGGCTFYFSNRPKIEMDFTGLANLADFGGISEIVRGVIHQVLADKIVLPNAITQLVGYSTAAVYPLVMGPPHPPIGVLRVTTVKAEGIRSGDWTLFASQAVDDNYIKFTMGDQEWKAPTAEMGKSHCFFVHDSLQRLSVDVFDEDQWTSDDYLGKVGDWTAEEAEAISDRLLHLHDPEHPNEDAGHLQFKVEYLKTLPRDLPTDTDMCMIVAHFKEVVLPTAELKGKLALRCKIGSLIEPKTTNSGKPLGGVTRKIAEKILADVEKRLKEESVEDNVIERVVNMRGLDIEKDLSKVAINCHLNFLVSLQEMPATDLLQMELELLELPEKKSKDKEENQEKVLGTAGIPLQELLDKPSQDIDVDIEILAEVDGEQKEFKVQASAQICALKPEKPPPAAEVDTKRDSISTPSPTGKDQNGAGTDKKSAYAKAGAHSMRLPVGGFRRKKAKDAAAKGEASAG